MPERSLLGLLLALVATLACSSYELLSGSRSNPMEGARIVLQKASEKSAQAQEWLEPHLESLETDAQKLSEPYIDRVAAAAKPHIEQARVALNPHTERVVRAYKKLRKSTRNSSRSDQRSIYEQLRYDANKSVHTPKICR